MNRRLRHPHVHRRGFWLADAITGIGILVILTLMLANATKHYRAGSDRLADTRVAERLAEQTMLALQSHQPPPTSAQGDTIEIAPLDEKRDLPTGCTWIRVRVVHHDRASELLGVVRADAVKGDRP
jgi:hypothetical protein